MSNFLLSALLTTLLCLGASLFSVSAYANTAQSSSVPGVNSVGGSLPIGAGGNNVMYVLSSGSVGVGTANPVATLDVSGGVHVGNDTNLSCNATTIGTIAFDPASQKFVGCSNGSQWTSLGEGMNVTEIISSSESGNITSARAHALCVQSSTAFWAPGHLETISIETVKNSNGTWSTNNNSGTSGGTSWNETLTCYN